MTDAEFQAHFPPKTNGETNPSLTWADIWRAAGAARIPIRYGLVLTVDDLRRLREVYADSPSMLAWLDTCLVSTNDRISEAE